jgi:hypothetical protein
MEIVMNSRTNTTSTRLMTAGGFSAIVAMLLFAPPFALADNQGNADTVIGEVCMQDVYDDFGQGGGLNCTANDVKLATATDITILDDGCAFPGDTVTFTAAFQVEVNSGSANDIGIYIALDGDPNADGALTGTCTVSTPAYAPGPLWLDLDGTGDNTTDSNNFGYCSTDGGSTIAIPTTPCDGGSPAAGDAQCVAKLGAGATCEEFGDGITSPLQDTCGDLSKTGQNANSPIFPTLTQTVVCVDTDGDGQLDLPYCTSWRQTGGNELCLTPLAAYPGAPSKCNCDVGFGIDIVVPGAIIVDKVTDPEGDTELFGFEVKDAGGTTISSFDLADATDPVRVAPLTSLGDCAVGDTNPECDIEPLNKKTVGGGTFSVTETVPTGWNLDSANCVSDQGNPDQTDTSSLTVKPGETLTCTFTNLQQPGTLVVKKEIPQRRAR